MTEVFVFPLDHRKLRAAAKAAINRRVEAAWSSLVPRSTPDRRPDLLPELVRQHPNIIALGSGARRADRRPTCFRNFFASTRPKEASRIRRWRTS